jgi:hypothetical protein
MILSHTYFHQKKWKLFVLQAANYAFLELLTYPQDTENLSIKNLSTLKFSKEMCSSAITSNKLILFISN